MPQGKTCPCRNPIAKPYRIAAGPLTIDGSTEVPRIEESETITNPMNEPVPKRNAAGTGTVAGLKDAYGQLTERKTKGHTAYKAGSPVGQEDVELLPFTAVRGRHSAHFARTYCKSEGTFSGQGEPLVPGSHGRGRAWFYADARHEIVTDLATQLHHDC
jgi:hypothetical protein